jgi:hypothetical protein
MKERRIAERVRPAEECIVVHSNTIGNINDISTGGLYCTCFQDSTCEKDIHRQIDILCGHGKFLVKGVKVKIINSEVNAGRFLKNFEIIKCRLQFVEVEDKQASGIETIVEGACVHQ